MKAQDLKNSILQLAIQGKLVEQREEEGTAKELLVKIEAEKKQLIKEGKIKKQNALPKIEENEKPFDIPESWEWVRLESVTYSIGNKSNQIKQSEIRQEGQYPVVSQSMNRIEGYSNEEGKLLTVKDLAVIVFGDHSKTLKLIDFDFIIGADGTKIMAPIVLNPEYLYHALNYNAINMTDRGYSRHFQFLKKKLLPIPPLEEQKRIVAKIEELLPYVDKYDTAYTEVEALNKKFPEDMQKSILQYAIQGKLVEQREEDGTAEELYQQIQEEKRKLVKEGKIKKTRALPEISDDEIPFDIPENWKWVRFSEVIDVRDGTHDTPAYVSNGYPLITGKDFYNGFFELSKTKFVSEKDYIEISKRSNVETGDILFSMIGGNIGSMILIDSKNYFEMGIKNVALFKQYTPSMIMSKYLMYYLKSQVLKIKANASGGAQAFVSLTILRSYLFPLPPIGEQKRIIEKLDMVLPYANQLL